MNGLPLQLFNSEKYAKKYLKDKTNFRCDNPAGGAVRKGKVEDEDVDDTTKAFTDKTIFSGKSNIFMWNTKSVSEICQ